MQRVVSNFFSTSQVKTVLVIAAYKEFEKSRSQNTSCYYQVYQPDEHHKHSGTAERVHRMSKSWLEQEGKDISKLL